MIGTAGLSKVSTKDLKALLRSVYRQELSCPITQIGLATTGLLRLGDDLQILRGLNERAVQAILVAVLAERRR